MKKLLLFVFLISLLSPTFSQAEFPENGPVFRDNLVPRIDISIPADTLEWIYDNVHSDIEFRTQFVFTTDTLQDTLQNVGFRLRGNTSRESEKKSFKLSFNTFEDGREFYGLEKLNLNGEHNDPSIIRSKISWDLVRKFGIPAPRANHVQVYINEQYYGLYIQVEHIDEEFVDSRFENKDGNLYKCLWPADLNYRGNSGDDYKHYNGDRRVYDLKTNELADDYSDLAFFIEQLNYLPADEFACEMERIFNVKDYLRAIALDVFLGNWDGPIYNKNNFYLYHNTKSNRLEYIPYDLDNTLGIDWMGRDWGTRDIYDWQNHGESRPIYTKMMENPDFREMYSQYMNELLNDTISGSSLENRILALKEMIAPYVANDPYYPLDYGYTFQDFNDSYTQALGDHVDYGLLPYIETRRNSAIQQLETFTYQPIINHIRDKAKNEGQDLRVRAYVREACDSVWMLYSYDDGEMQQLLMYDDGAHFDRLPNDGVYANTFESIPLNTLISYQIKAKNAQQIVNISPCQARTYYYRPSEEVHLVINEFMASNDSIIADEFGDYGDWIELYNAHNQEVYLGDKYLSDNISDPNKWQMPDISLASGGFVLFWADSDTDKGPMHTNFKLKKSGEEIGVFDAVGTGYFPLDTLHYESQITNVSQGRSTDGGELWQFFVHPTPGITNLFDAIDELEKTSLFQAYPNPNSNGHLYLNTTSDIQIYSLRGSLLLEARNTNDVNIGGLSKGIYIIRNAKGQSLKLIVQ